MIQCRALSDPIQGAAISSTPPPIHATVPACQTSRIRVRKLSGSMVALREHLGFAEHAVDDAPPGFAATPAHCSMMIAHRNASIQYCMVYDAERWRLSIQWCMVRCRRTGTMADQLSAQDWLDQGLKTLAKSGFTALKAEPLAKAMGVSRGSFYWHFADIGAFHAAILKHWREIAAEQIIAGVEAAAGSENPLAVLLRRVFGEG